MSIAEKEMYKAASVANRHQSSPIARPVANSETAEDPVSQSASKPAGVEAGSTTDQGGRSAAIQIRWGRGPKLPQVRYRYSRCTHVLQLLGNESDKVGGKNFNPRTNGCSHHSTLIVCRDNITVRMGNPTIGPLGYRSGFAFEQVLVCPFLKSHWVLALVAQVLRQQPTCQQFRFWFVRLWQY